MTDSEIIIPVAMLEEMAQLLANGIQAQFGTARPAILIAVQVADQVTFAANVSPNDAVHIMSEVAQQLTLTNVTVGPTQ